MRAFLALAIAVAARVHRDPTISTWFRSCWDGQSPITLRRDGHTLRALFRGRHKRLRTTWIVLRNGHKRGTFIPTRPPKCRFVLVTGPNGQQQWVSVC